MLADVRERRWVHPDAAWHIDEGRCIREMRQTEFCSRGYVMVKMFPLSRFLLFFSPLRAAEVIRPRAKKKTQPG